MTADVPAATKPPKRRARRVLFAFAVAVVFAGVLELTARIALPRVELPVLFEPLADGVDLTPSGFFRPHPTLYWELQPNLRLERPDYWGDVTNSDGLRMRREVGPKDGRLRVACFGDSCTYGLGLGIDDAWPSVLSGDPALDVINAGVPGYTSYQGALLADMRCPEWKPDVVVASFGINDSFAWLHEVDGNLVAVTDEQRASSVRFESLVRRSAFLTWIVSRARAPRTRSAVAAPPASNAPTPAGPDATTPDLEAARALYRQGLDRVAPRVTPEQFRANLVRIARHAPYAIVLLWPRRIALDPARFDVMSVERITPYVSATQSVGNDFIDFVNVADRVVASGMTADEAFLDPVHGTRAMSDLVARLVRDRIRDRLRR